MLARTLMGLTLAVGFSAGLRAEDKKPDAGDQLILDRIKKAALTDDFEKLGIDSREKEAAEFAKRSEVVAALLKELPAASPLLNEARIAALKVMLMGVQRGNVSTRDAMVGIVKDLKAAAPDKAPDAELDVLRADFAVLVKGVDSLAKFQEVYKARNAEFVGFAKKLTDHVAANPKHAEGADFAMEMADIFEKVGGTELGKTITAGVAKILPNHEAVRAAAEGPIKAPKVGELFDFAFTPVGSDKQLTFKDLRGKVVVIDYWATWCGPCRAEMPHMKELYEKYKDKGVEFIGISLDRTQDALKNYVKDNKIGWPQCFGVRAQKLAEASNVQGIPTLFIIGKDGKLRSMEARGELDKLIPDLLAEK